MPCYTPLNGYRSRHINSVLEGGVHVSNGKRSVVFSRSEGFADLPISVPCGKCIGCVLARAAGWAVRATHESECHTDSIFLTLTYSDVRLPDPPIVSKEDLQKFLKRLRKRLEPAQVRYLACGEYGSFTLRPHYHLLIFGWRPDDAIFHADRPTGRVFISQSIFELWPFGLHEFGTVTPASAGYVARYTTKKLLVPPVGGEEFLLQSRVPPLGIPWLAEHYREVYPADQVRLGGKWYRPPTSYDKWMDVHHPDLFRRTRMKRVDFALDPHSQSENFTDRLDVREQVTHARIRGLSRGL